MAARESHGKPWRFVGFPASIRYLHHGILSSFALDRSSLVFVPFASSLLVSRSSRGTGLRDASVRRACFSIPREPRLRLVHAPSISIRARRKDFSTRRKRIANEGREICTRISGVAVNYPRSTGNSFPVASTAVTRSRTIADGREASSSTSSLPYSNRMRTELQYHGRDSDIFSNGIANLDSLD